MHSEEEALEFMNVRLLANISSLLDHLLGGLGGFLLEKGEGVLRSHSYPEISLL